MHRQPTGIFYVNAGNTKQSKVFPKEFRSQPFKRVDIRYWIVLGISLFVLGMITFLLSLRELPTETTDKEIQKIQERYAQLVLNQPRPQVEKVEEKVDVGSEEASPEAEPEEETPEKKVDRKKESFVQKQARKERSSEQRKRERQKIAQQVQSVGLFAAISSSGGSDKGAASGVSDLLGASEVLSGIGDIDISEGSFATNEIKKEQLTARKGTRRTGVSIKKSDVGKATSQQLASSGTVNVTSEPPTISGDDEQVLTSKSCLNRIIKRQRSRIKKVFETWLKRDPNLGGRITVKFTILANGGVSGVKVLQSTTGNTKFDQTITRYIKRWQFSTCTITSPIEIELPFVFEAQS